MLVNLEQMKAGAKRVDREATAEPTIQRDTVDLAAVQPGELVGRGEQRQVTRHLVGRDPFTEQGSDLIGGDLRTGGEHGGGGDALATLELARRSRPLALRSALSSSAPVEDSKDAIAVLPDHVRRQLGRGRGVLGEARDSVGLLGHRRSTGSWSPGPGLTHREVVRPDPGSWM